MTGQFLTLEGGEGAGKSTQARHLADRLRAAGVEVQLTREPGGSAGGEAVRTLLMQGGTDRWSAQAETLLFAAARADHVERVIRPALAAGRWVLCDRYVDSTRAYQGAQGVDDDDVMALHRFGSGGLMPDRTLLLRIDTAAGVERMHARDGGAADRFGARGAAFHQAVAAAFDRIAADEPARVRVIDASGSIDAVADAVWSAVVDMLP